MLLMGLSALTQTERLELCFYSRVYLLHWELPGLTLYLCDRNFKYEVTRVIDLSGYTEVDIGADRISVASDAITVDSLDEDEAVYCYKDYGTGFFSDSFTHYVDTKVTWASTPSNGTPRCYPWVLANSVGAIKPIIDASGDYVAVRMGKEYISIQECVGGSVTGGTPATITTIFNTQYYLQVVFNSGEGTYGKLYCHVYSDAGLTTEIAGSPTSIELSAPLSFRYHYCMNSYGGAMGGVSFKCVISNPLMDDPVINYENYLWDLSNLPVELNRVSGNRNFKTTLRFRNVKILDKDYLIELNDDYRFTFSTIKIYELRLVESGETFASDVKTLMFRGIAGQPYDITRKEFKIDVHNVLLAKRDRLPLTVVDSTTFPSADPDDLGKIRNTIYGSLDQVPCLCVEGGAVDNLNEELDASEVEIDLSDAGEFPSSGTIGIDEEEITYTGKSSNTLTGCTRGANATAASEHAQGAAVWEIPARFVYEAAKHPVKSIGNVYVASPSVADRYYNITSVVTAYTGQSGDELAGYEGTAVIVVPYRITRLQAVNLILDTDGLDVNNGTLDVYDEDLSINIASLDAVVNTTIENDTHSHDVGAESIFVWEFEVAAVSDGAPLFPWAAVDNDFDTYANIGETDDAIKVSKGKYTAIPGTPTYYRLCGRSGTIDTGGGWLFRMRTGSYYEGERVSFGAGDDSIVKKSDWIAVDSDLDSSEDWNNEWGYVASLSSTSVTNNKVGEVWVEIKYIPSGTSEDPTGATADSSDTIVTGSASKTTAASLDGTVGFTKDNMDILGRSVADVAVGSLLTCNVDGYQDDGSGTITGTPNALIERPDHVFQHILTELLGESAGDIGASFAASGASYSTTYKFGFILHEVADQADKLLQRLAFECRSKFIEWRGKFELIYMGAAPAVTRTFTDDELLAEPVFGFTDEIDIRNKVYARHTRDYRLSDGDGAYGGIVDDSDATSISDNGERIEMINLTACRDATMAADWVAWYLTQVKDIHKTVELLVPWLGKALGAGNTFGLTFDLFTGLTWDTINVDADQDRERLKIKGMEWPT